MKRARALAAALAFAAAGAALSWPGVQGGTLAEADDPQNARIAWNLARHGVFHDTARWRPGADPYLRREPGHPVFIALALATDSSFPEVAPECVLDPRCAAGEALRERYRRANLAVVAMAVGATFLAALVLTRSWPLALAAGVAALFLIRGNVAGNALAGMLLLAHALLAWRAWRRPRAAAGALAGLALGLAVLVEAVLQYWLVGLAALAAAGLWREAGRRRLLAGMTAAMLLAAALPVGLWMARNYAVAGQFTVSGRSGEILAIRAEYAQATWSEIRGMLAYRLPVRDIEAAAGFKERAMERLRPEAFGYTRMGDGMGGDPNLAGFYPRAKFAFKSPTSDKGAHSEVARRADLLAPGWRRKPQHERDAVFRRASLQLIREDWPKHLAISVPFALRGMDHRCRRYSGLHRVSGAAAGVNEDLCAASKVLSFTFVPAALALLVLAARRRDTALALLVLPAVYFFGIHALATHFVPRTAEPALPLLTAAAALAAHECLRRIRRRTRRGGVRPPAPC